MVPAITFDAARAEHFAVIALGHVTREYPHKLDHVLSGRHDARSPRELHPIFFGSFDWHSCVHGYWLLARVLRRFPRGTQSPSIRRLFDQMLTPANVAGELAYLARPESAGFERPYGWAWLLKLQAELRGLQTPRWAQALEPLAAAFAARLAAFLPLADYPLRAGVHSNSAFALRLAVDYAAGETDGGLESLIRVKALQWYGEDRDCSAWEPSGDEFLSPALMEAELMRRLLDPAAFQAWFIAFLPRAADRTPPALFAPVRVSDRSDGKIAHLDGLNLSRAWCWRSIGEGLALDNPVRLIAPEAARRHLEASLPHLAGDYMGEHWLASFAVLALDE